ncbi:hypothetical protein MTO96_033753 [Rhipicephalus appendiculatus]
MNSRDTEDICRMAKEKKLSLMEALWSRFMPTYKHMEELLSERRHRRSSLPTLYLWLSPMNKQGRMLAKKLGGSVLLTLGSYSTNIVLQVFGAERPVKISACGHLTSEGEVFDCSQQ